VARFTPHTAAQVEEMLAAVGVDSIGALFSDIPPALTPESFVIEEGMSEMAVLARLGETAAKNQPGVTIFAGGGYYDHYIPAAVDAIASRSEFYTAYTPYQPEASQGTLQAIFEYQTMIARLTGLDVANASLYDGGTALCEAISMAHRANSRNRVVICGGVNPLYREIVRTYLSYSGLELDEVKTAHFATDSERIASRINEGCAAVVLQSPNFFGTIEDHREIFALAKQRGAVPVAVFNPALSGVLASPAEMGAEIAVAEGQSLGIPLAFGGPSLGILAASRAHMRRMPGRIVGETVDRNGRRCYVLTLQAREQHIRREKATSNICSNQALCALRALVYLSLVGGEGLADLGRILAAKGNELKTKLSPYATLMNGHSLHEFTVRLDCDAAKFARRMSRRGFLAGIPASLGCRTGENISDIDKCLIVAVTEKRTTEDITRYLSAFAQCLRGDDE